MLCHYLQVFFRSCCLLFFFHDLIKYECIFLVNMYHLSRQKPHPMIHQTHYHSDTVNSSIQYINLLMLVKWKSDRQTQREREEALCMWTWSPSVDSFLLMKPWYLQNGEMNHPVIISFVAGNSRGRRKCGVGRWIERKMRLQHWKKMFRFVYKRFSSLINIMDKDEEFLTFEVEKVKLHA